MYLSDSNDISPDGFVKPGEPDHCEYILSSSLLCEFCVNF